MIIIKLMGGLGNQMFQYAFGRYLAFKHDVNLKLDVSQLNDTSFSTEHTIREYGLNVFSIAPEIAKEQVLKSYRRNKAGKIIDMFFLYLPFKMNGLYIREPHFRFFKKALNAPRSAYLDGYWQSEKYFIKIRGQLLDEFSLAAPLSEESKKIVEKIQSNNAVSVHVRRGDYLSIASNKKLFGTCDERYYTMAMDKISKSVAEPRFYVFSDEPEWFRENIRTSFPVEYVTHNAGRNSYQDLYLMSICKHNIIANSSFSWWGAWLNRNTEKIVIAPKNWFENNAKNIQDLIPESWIKL